MVMVDHFSGMPFYSKMNRTTAEAVTMLLTTLFNMYGACKFIKTDRGPPFSSAAFEDFCKQWWINLNLKAPYCPTNLGGAERLIGVLKELLKRVETHKSCFETAFDAYKTNRTEYGYSPAQLFFLRNVRTPKLPSLGQSWRWRRWLRPGIASGWTLAEEVSTVAHGGRAY